GIDAPAEVKNVVNDVLKDYVNQLNDLRNKLITLRSDIDSLSIPEFSTRNLINNSKTLDGLVDSKNITLNGFYDCNVATTTYTNEFPTENYYNLLTAYPTVKVHKGNYTISFVAWADNEGDMISNYFFSSETNTDSGITSQGKKTGAGDGSAEITL